MATISDTVESFQVELSAAEVRRAIEFLLKERERSKLKSRRKRLEIREARGPVEPKPPAPKKSYYVPTGRPRGRPRKLPAAEANLSGELEHPGEPKN